MKIVSFKVAKALKEAGYPQCYMGQDWCYENGQYPDESECDSPPPFTGYLLLPTYMETWLWLWRKKKIKFSLEPNDDSAECYNSKDFGYLISKICDDPEEAIVEAINHLVTNKLLK